MRIIKFRGVIISVLLLLFLLSLNDIIAQETDLFVSQDEKEEFVKIVSERLVDRYVFKEVAEDVATYLTRQFEEGVYDTITKANNFIQIMTNEIQSVSHDKHMRVIIRRPRPKLESGSEPLIDQYLRTLQSESENYGFNKVEILEGNIGYVDFRYFASPVKANDRVVAVMNFLKYTDAIIYDLRKNGGGNPEMIQLMCSYLFDEKTHLNSLYWRDGDRIVEYWTLDNIDGVRLPDIPVYVLTSSYTFSGAEEFAYNLKTRKRAIIIGETSGGGANPGGMHSITDNLAMFIPDGRAINPITGTNWEGIGVEPDIKVDADSALSVALYEAKPAAEKYKKSKIDKAEILISDMHTIEIEVEKLVRAGKIEKARETFYQVLETGINQKLLNEMDINRMGYEYLRKNKTETALIVFKFNVMAFPNAFNTYDSLGEVYMTTGNKELAIQNYKKSLELNPKNNNAAKMLEQLMEN
jgi:predicted negative regulator of RcsB-dependent stress response